MAQATFGKIKVKSATDDQIKMVRRTLDRCKVDPSRFLRRPITVKFTHALPARGDGGPAWAFSFFSRDTIGINPSLTPYQQKYCLLHEIGHFVDRDHLTHVKRREIMDLMRPHVPGGRETPNSAWVRGNYRPMPAECFAEYFVQMVSDVRPINRGFFERRINAPRAALEVVERNRSQNEPDDDPVDLPEDPHGPIGEEPGSNDETLRDEIAADIDALRDELAELEEALKELLDKVGAPAGGGA